ncbi:MAG: NusA-like transcription termination signal-binding factor [Candidatus Aenigmatarchaeota archaeon]
MKEFNTEDILAIAAFENLTGCEVRDYINCETLYFLVGEGRAAMAIGKEGKNIKNAERILQKPIKIFEFSYDTTKFVKNLIPQAQKVGIEGEKIVVNIPSKERGAVIGKAGAKIKIIRELLERNSGFKELKIL